MNIHPLVNKKLLREVLFLCLKESGKILRQGFGTVLKVSKKGPVNLVTDIDIASERKIVSIIKEKFPDHRILTEESNPYESPSKFRWIIDPLDGTTNYAHQIPLCCVSIALEFNGELMLGGIYNPLQNELFFAEKGKGAFLNGKRIQISKTTKLQESLMVTGFPYDRLEKAEFYLKFFKGMMVRCQGVRRLGAAAIDLAYVACGRFDAFWEFNLKPWDVAAGILIVEEAGGKISDFKGLNAILDSPFQILASNGKVHSQIVTAFRPILKLTKK
ncbi:MAG: hypothetical protein A3I11_01440 [Elusimicrobia bacterium RIFCSPLOWO2_02_FULL_39_32]|nr:MAG: hypothetical protein A3B80_05925 [Elusimicrobia bacterium RIFCSPHIGHO2_02_FULL_39_36]OGR92344.1 MAG: hypothetical protein A3I11_01440 [Elusimicrobia bacterium RIFCSPLOWO2_02_FULL_39_32]OGR98887.1 MAG: hypothetical protein A3G85_03745 [Elusimicrobia bacterium RIFCSPLOWO2_12_FULL_39_28]